VATRTETTGRAPEVVAPGAADLETARRGRGVPAFDELRPPPRQLRRFVAGVLAAAAAVVLSVLAFNIVVDPFGTFGTGIFPTAIESDRSAKITLLQDLPYNPDILIMGSSRSRPARPKVLQELTGRSGFNAGVTSGGAVDWWVFAHLWLKRYPRGPHHVLLFVSDGVGTNAVNPQLAADSRASPYLPKGLDTGEWSFLHKLEAYTSVDAARDSYRVVRACLRPAGCHTGFFHADGSLKENLLRSAAVRTKRMYAKLSDELARIRRNGISHRLPSEHEQLTFERLLGYLNDHGITPVIVTNPLQPQLLAALNRQGNPRYKWSLNYLASLHDRFRFDFIDLTSIKTFGGSADDFSDPTHVDTRNMDRMLRYIVAHDDGIL
jgi:hypothetical protein